MLVMFSLRIFVVANCWINLLLTGTILFTNCVSPQLFAILRRLHEDIICRSAAEIMKLSSADVHTATTFHVYTLQLK